MSGSALVVFLMRSFLAGIGVAVLADHLLRWADPRMTAAHRRWASMAMAMAMILGMSLAERLG